MEDIKGSFSFFGLTDENSNRNLENQTPDQINTSFPVALLCRMNKLGVKPNYLMIEKGAMKMSEIDASRILGDDAGDTYFGFEASCENPAFTRFDKNLPRTDVYFTRKSDRANGKPIEMKYVVMPDKSTSGKELDLQGPELVVRPDSIVHLAAYLCATSNLDNIKKIFSSFTDSYDFTDPSQVRTGGLDHVISTLQRVATQAESTQQPFLCMPIWKTDRLHDLPEGFDMFFFSDAAFVQFIATIVESSNTKDVSKAINRKERAAIWLYLLLKDAAQNGSFDHEKTFSRHSFNVMNDKAFAVNGSVMNKFLYSPNLFSPRISFADRKNIMSLTSMKSKRIFTDVMQKYWNID